MFLKMSLTLSHLSALLLAHLMGAPPELARGADIGWLSQMESSGRVFKDAKGTSGDLLDILKGVGVNSIRLRVWVNPTDGWCGPADVLKMAQRAKAKGYRIMIDFHYSDSWADPGKQTKPAAWSSHGIAQLRTDVANHTTLVLQSLKTAGITPEWVQIGNETNNGMLWEEGKASVNMANFAGLVQSGSKAAKAVFPATKVIVHLSNGYDNALFRWMFDGLRANGAEWDVIGMSLYPQTPTWRTMVQQCRANMLDMVSRYGKQVVIAEVGMPQADVDSSYACLKQLQKDVAALPNGAGLGVFYWEPAAYASWQGYKLGAFDDSGKPTRALDAFRELATTTVHRNAAPTPVARDAAHDALGRARTLPPEWNGSIGAMPAP
jgi:arabinogalactan endo-1,4-beta-galactosidase